MGVELHITRAEHWVENDGAQISEDEWLTYVSSDPELRITGENGKCFAIWSGPSKYGEPWLDWSRGNISTKWPDAALFQKMLRIAEALGATVQDDEGNEYSKPGDWTFDPAQETLSSPIPTKLKWWQKLLGR